MSRTPSTVKPKSVRMTVSAQSHRMLEDMVARGHYGRTVPEVAARIVEAVLADKAERHDKWLARVVAKEDE